MRPIFLGALSTQKSATMTQIPEPTKTTANQIHWLYEQKQDAPRPHMGCSVIGHSCDRAIWLTWRWALAPTFSGRIKRLFDTGHREEARIQSDLIALGVELYTVDQETGKQISVTALDGHLAGSVDGIGRGFVEGPKSWAVLECKTHNAKSFADVQKKGVAASKKQHFAQIQMYLGLLGLDRAIYIAQCKDDDHIYTEWVHFDKEPFDYYMARAKRLIASAEVPDGISSDPAWYECKWCDFYAVCHGKKVAQPNCRTCTHSTPSADASWRCESHFKALTYAEQIEGCKDHLYIPKLIPFADPIDGGKDFVQYQVRGTDKTFVNSGKIGDYASREIHMLDPVLVGDKKINDMKELFGGEVIEGSKVSLFDMADDLDDVYKVDNSAKGKKKRAELAQTAAQVEALQQMGQKHKLGSA